MMTEALISRKMPVAAPQCWECCIVTQHTRTHLIQYVTKHHTDQESLTWPTHQNAFTGALLFAAGTFETDEGPADKAEGGVFWHLFASGAGLPVVVLEDDVVVVGQLEEAGRRPLVVLREQSLHREKEEGGGGRSHISTM